MSLTISTDATPAELDIRAGMNVSIRNRRATDDVVGGLRLWRLAWTLGWLDIRLRYRGSMLGPFWLTISTGVMIAALGVLYSTLFKLSLREYLPFLALSQVLWGYLSTTVSESCAAFTEAEGVVRSVRMPFFVFSIRVLIRNLMVLAHNIAVIVVVFVIFAMWPHFNSILALPGLVIWAFDSLALTLLLGGFCARFRDIQPIVNSLMQIAFFVTPVIWKPSQLGPTALRTLVFNPFYDLLEVVRGPILGTPVSLSIWGGAIIYSLALIALSWAFFVKARGRLAFWI